ERALRVVDGRFDLAAMADDAGIAEQPLDDARAHLRHARDLEAVEGLAEVLALSEDGEPAQPRLEPFETELFEQPCVGRDRPAPFLVVVADVNLLAPRPAAAMLPVHRRLHCFARG